MPEIIISEFRLCSSENSTHHTLADSVVPQEGDSVGEES
jgi:hypothetical protein